MHELNWTCRQFKDLTVFELYAILKIRSEVFVVEQQCVYLDADNRDQPSYHLCGWLEDTLVAYARIIPPGICYEEASIGRVCTAPSYRNNGAGRMLMIQAIDKTFRQFENAGIKIGAQRYLQKFYSSLGFMQSSEEYLEDGIVHIEMLLSK